LKPHSMDDDFECLITHDGDEKYIIAVVDTGVRKKTWLVSHPLSYHSEIAMWFEDYLKEKYPASLVQVQGGGIITVSHGKKFIKTYGQSGKFLKKTRQF